MAFVSRPDLFAGRRIIHFIDNTTALSALVNGYSGKADLARLVKLFHVATIALCCEWWGECRVPSKANLADIPTRDESASRRPAHVLNPSDAVVRMAHDASCRTFPGSVRSLVGRPEPSKRPPGWPG